MAAPRAVVAVGCAALAVAMGIGRFAFTPLLPMMQQDVGLSVADGGWLASANYLGYLVGALSAVALRVSPATVMRGALLATGLLTLGMGVTAGLATWLVLRLLAGVASAWVFVFASSWCLGRLAAAGRSGLNGAVYSGVGVGMAAAGGLCLVFASLDTGAARAWIGQGALALAVTAAIWRPLGAANQDHQAADERSGAGDWRWSVDSARVVACYGALGFGYIIPATFVPAMARQLVQDPLVFGASWPPFGIAAALSTLAAAAAMRRLGTRPLWALGHAVMALGVAAPVVWPSIGGIMVAAIAVGGTFVVATMAGMQEARAIGGAHARRLMAIMTAAFAAGQILGPLFASATVGPNGDFARPLSAAAALLVASALALLPAPALPRDQEQ